MARFTTTISTQPQQPGRRVRLHGGLQHAREWDPSVPRRVRQSSGPVGVGTTFTIVSRFGPRVVPLTYRIVRHEPDRAGRARSARQGFVSADTITVEPVGRGAASRTTRVLAFAGSARLADPIMQSSSTGSGARPRPAARGAVIARAVDGLLEASVVGSFTRVGYHARRRLYRGPRSTPTTSRGATRSSPARRRARLRDGADLPELGARVCIVGRDAERTEPPACGWSVRRAAPSRPGSPTCRCWPARGRSPRPTPPAMTFLDMLVHNAGALLRGENVDDRR